MKELITVNNLSLGYKKEDRVIVREFNFSLFPGELVCLLGPNGSGKSTLIKTLGGIIPPLSGGVLLGGSPLKELSPSERAKRMGIVLTQTVSPGYFKVFDLVALGRHPYTNWRGVLSGGDKKAVLESLEAVGAGSLTYRYVSRLSDGEKQKVMIARALAQEPEVLLLDEPTAFLDLPRKLETFQLLKNLSGFKDKAVFLSTHDLDLALQRADRIILLDSKGGWSAGAPEDLVLDGSIERSFVPEGVLFDKESGRFILPQKNRGEAVIVGAGLAGIWTAKALKRAGLSVLEDPADPGGNEEAAGSGKLRIEIKEVPHGTVWAWRYRESGGTAESLYLLIRQVKETGLI